MFDLYTTKPGGDQNSKGWRWVLNSVETGLSRKAAARLADKLKAEDPAVRVIVYSYGEFCYTR